MSGIVIKVDPKVVKGFPRPLTPTGITKFLGLVVYYRRFVEGFAFISSPLTTLTQKKAKFEWLKASDKRFKELNDKLISALVLTLPEGNGGFIVYCDASRLNFAYVLMKHRKVIAYV